MEIEKLTDIEIVQLQNKLSSEIERRIIELLKKKKCTLYYFQLGSEPFLEVFNAYDSFDHNKTIRVFAIGYNVIEWSSGEFDERIFILDNEFHFYSGDELGDLGEVYIEFKKRL